MQAQDVAFGIREPCSLLGTKHAHVVDGREARQVVVSERDATSCQVADLGGDVGHLETHRRVRGLLAVRFRHERKHPSLAESEELLTLGVRTEVRQPERVSIETPGAFSVDDGEDCGHRSVCEHGKPLLNGV